ncbi:cadherin-2-like [Poecilia latipinna]|uniref:cadherin-2-like n=1 Tax=Poecilia latipinna TaxID=48699 RepID=UPI00072DFCA8|nr:PREDICTED: cadherin-2-like [Poecilia latipinna]
MNIIWVWTAMATVEVAVLAKLSSSRQDRLPCTKGFSQEEYYTKTESEMAEGQAVFNVTFRNCDEGNVQLKAADTSAFTVSQEGVIYTLQPLSLGVEEKPQVMIYAQDLQSNRIWYTRVHLEINTAPEQVRQQHTLPKGFTNVIHHYDITIIQATNTVVSTKPITCWHNIGFLAPCS